MKSQATTQAARVHETVSALRRTDVASDVCANDQVGAAGTVSREPAMSDEPSASAVITKPSQGKVANTVRRLDEVVASKNLAGGVAIARLVTVGSHAPSDHVGSRVWAESRSALVAGLSRPVGVCVFSHQADSTV